MKKLLLMLCALFAFTLCQAQENPNNKVDGESINAAIQEIRSRINSLKQEISALQNKNCSCSCHEGDADDPYTGHEYVDLGLPSGLKWATCNVGATSPEEYGDYFTWGATQPQEVYDWVHTPYQTQNTTDIWATKFLKYLGSTTSVNKDPSATDADALKTVLDPEDDAAHVNWKGSWRMPTKEELDELIDNCYWQWVTTYNGKEVEGCIVYKAKQETDKGKRNNSEISANYSVSDTHIFLPAAGGRWGSGLENVGSIGGYWSSSLYSNHPGYAYCLRFDSSSVGRNYNVRYDGHTVRAVCP